VRSPGAVVSRICPGSRSESKNRDKQLTHIVRVMFRRSFKIESSYNSLKFIQFLFFLFDAIIS